MILSRTKNALAGSLWGIAYRISATILPFIIRTIIIKEFGSEYLGLNSLFTSVLQVLNLSELGLSSAIVYSMYKPIADDDQETIGALLKLYRKLYLVIGVVILSIGLFCMPFLPRLINGTYPNDINIYWFYLIYLGSTCVSYFFFAYKEALLSAYQRNDILNIVRLVVFSTQFIIQAIVLILFKDFYIYALVMFFSTLIRGWGNYYVAGRLFPGIQMKGSVPAQIIKEIKLNVMGIAIGRMCTISRGASNSIIISAFLGLTTLAIFDNYFYVSSALTAIMVIIETSLIAGVGNSINTDSVEKNYNDFKEINLVYMIIASCFVTGLLCLYQPFMEIWVGKELMLPTRTMILFCLYFFVSCYSSIPNVYSTATGLWWKLKYKSVAETILNIVLNVIAVIIFGLDGILYATILTLIIITFFWGAKILYNCFFVGKNVSDIVVMQIRYTIVAVSISAITYLICGCIVITDNLYYSLIIKVFICAVIPLVLYMLVFWKNQHSGKMQDIVLKLITKK